MYATVVALTERSQPCIYLLTSANFLIPNKPLLLLKDPVCCKKELHKAGCANIRYVKATKDSVMVSVPCQDASKLSCDLKVTFLESIITSKPWLFLELSGVLTLILMLAPIYRNFRV